MIRTRGKGSDAGLSLVETLVAMLLMSIIGITMFTLFKMYSDNADWSFTRFMLQRNYDIVANQIGRMVQQSRYVLDTGETAADFVQSPKTTGAIHLISFAGTDTLAYYFASDGYLYEKLGAGTLQMFKVGNTPISVGSTSRFILTPDRKLCTVNLMTKAAYSMRSDSLLVNGGLYLCRN
jgi:type II secretory pathway pseudopilin PulG